MFGLDCLLTWLPSEDRATWGLSYVHATLACSSWETEANCGAEECEKQTSGVCGGDLEEYSVVGVQGPRADAPESACSLYYYEQTPDHFPALKIKNILEFSDLVLIHFVPNFQKKCEAVQTRWRKCSDPFMLYFFHRFALRRQNRLSFVIIFY